MAQPCKGPSQVVRCNLWQTAAFRVSLHNCPDHLGRKAVSPDSACFVGLRIGEAIGIKWSDFDGDVLTVSRTIYEGKAQSPKTQKSVRSLPIPAPLLERMRKV